MADLRENAEIVGLLSKAGSILGSIWGIFQTIIYFPQILSKWLTGTLQSIMPAFLQWDIDNIAALILGFACAGLWARHWSKATGFVGKIVGGVPFLGGLLALLVPAFMWWSLYQGCRGITGAGWLQAILFLFITAAITMPGFIRKFWSSTVAAGAVGRDAISKGGKVAAKAGRAVSSVQWKDPLAKATREALVQLRRECTKGGWIDDADYLARADHLKGLLAEEHTDKVVLIGKIFDAYALESGIRTIEAKANTKALMRHLKYASVTK